MYFYRYLIIIIILTQFHSVFGQTTQSKLIQPRLIKIGITHAPPLVYLNKNQPPKGMLIDFLKTIAEKEKWKIVWVKGKWSEIYDKAKNKQIDLMTYIAYSQERTVYFNFSQISFVTGWGQVYTHNKDKFLNIFDFNNKTVALVKEDIHADGFIEYCQKFNVNCHLRYVDNYDIAFDLLEHKLIDGAVCGSTVGSTYEQKFNIERTAIMFHPTDALFATPKGKSSDVLKILDKYLSSWKKDPHSPYSKSKVKWMQGTQSYSIPSWVVVLVFVIFILLIIATIIVSVLRKKIKNHVKQYKNQSEQLKKIINLVPHMIYVVDKDNKLVLTNNYAAHHFGLTDSTNVTSTELTEKTPEYSALFEDDRNLFSSREEVLNKEIKTQNFTKDTVVFNVSKMLFDNFLKLPSILTVGVDITEELAYQNKIQFIAEHDDLTGLPNRELIKQSIQKSIIHSSASKTLGCVLYIDLDFFKNVNDSLGHAAGDDLLKVVSKRLQTVIGKNDMLARIGGDEFLIQLKHSNLDFLAAERHIKEKASKVLKVLSDKFLIRHNELYISASIGAIIYPRDAQSFVQTMQRADIAMYQAKANGKNGYVIFKQEMEEVIQQKQALVADLHKAVENYDFTLSYQPQVYRNNEKLVGLEALIRWNKEDGTLVYPTDFIKEAEECGLIIPIGDWVIEQVCSQLRDWLKHYDNIPMVTVNVSVLQFHNKDFYHKLKKLINTYAIPAHLIELEVTESIMVERVDQISDTLMALKKLGIKISIDDFGTGYSSLSYLKKLPIDKLKIDYSFIKDMISDADTSTLIKTIVGMTQDLGLEVIAEGVETIEQVEQLMQMGCYYFQGFYFDPPQSVAYIEKKYFFHNRSI